SGPAADTGPNGSGAVANLFDDKRSTAWVAASGPKEDAEIEFAFPAKMLLTGLVVEAGYQDSPGSASAYSYPKSVILEADGRKPVRLALSETESPQFLALSGILVEKGRLRFGSGASTWAPGTLPAGTSPAGALSAATPVGKPVIVREVRFLGLPYE
ncbi:MAG: hypothetical protein ABI036_01790, partial [Fibrobacteria bacterium]